MSLFPSSAIPAGSTAFDLEQSLRFNDDDSAYLSRTLGTATNRKKWTYSCWVKGMSESTNTCLLYAGDSTNFTILDFTNTANGHFRLSNRTSGDWDSYKSAGLGSYHTGNHKLFRDPSAWYNIIVVFDSTEGTPSNRLKLYVNGTLTPTWEEIGEYTSDFETHANNNVAHYIGYNPFDAPNYTDGYLSEVHFIDGTALDQTSFGETGTYGEWKPTAYAGTYGTNGFYLDFSGVNNTIIAATGGTIYTDGDYKYHKFTSDGTFTVTSTQGASIVDALVIAGGGGGGGDNGGGGGAGGYLYTAEHSVSATAYSITVGDGGAGAGGSDAVNGQNSVFSSLTATGGGFGGTNNKTHAGASGGSGGGGGGGTTGGGGSGTAGQGYAGGSSGGNTSPKSGGGGGGAGAVGSPGPSTGTGGIGSNAQSAWATITSSGDSGYYAGGAGAGHEGAGADNVGGTGGGGAGGGPSDTGVAGTANTGGGGGGAGSGGAGGSGIVIIRYKFQ